MATIIMNYRDNIYYLSSDQKKWEEGEILGDLIYHTIFNLIYTYYLNAYKLIKKLLDSFDICLYNWKYEDPNLF